MNTTASSEARLSALIIGSDYLNEQLAAFNKIEVLVASPDEISKQLLLFLRSRLEEIYVSLEERGLEGFGRRAFPAGLRSFAAGGDCGRAQTQ